MGVPENDETAVKWYTLAAEQGHADAQYSLGWMYDTGEGVPENGKRSMTWYTLAAEQGHVDAQFYLGAKYMSEDSIFKNYVRAYMWFNLNAYNGGVGDTFKALISRELTPAQIATAQDMSSRCLESGYMDC